ncbi:GGDEF domain-containing protein [Paraglaciecola sp. L3A3]|uniref:GGDEF domain-containing protein n=1 Tax=Paraglaciecola sp. L3A3 TaxID=2686358 RepID=UPI00131D4C81|nr:GGDEF domain-containing protein [Paraglaciecola sp. L3A3]
MNFSENSDQAVEFLRLAVPTMMKFNIVPNPLNYTLWYSYYSKAFPRLNKELDQTIERYGTCPPKIAESLFLQHIGHAENDNEQQLIAFQASLSHLASNLSDSINTTAKQASGFSSAIAEKVSLLDDVDTNISPVLNELTSNINGISKVNDSFQAQLSDAQAEINTLKEELEDSKREASTDPLTGLFNRRVLDSIFKEFVNNPNSTKKLTFIIMDIDKFKIFNDTHGHILGDQILKIVANLLKNECKKPVVPIRLGGEEFGLICPEYDLPEAHKLADGIREKLASRPYTNKRDGKKIPPVTASFGIAAKHRGDALTNIIERADKALYKAKEAGRNQVILSE